MKNYKGNMLLIELVIVILFFSLSQVVLVQVFAGAQKSTRDNDNLNVALLKGQDIIERISQEDHLEEYLLENGFVWDNGTYVADFEQGIYFSVSVESTTKPSGDLHKVELSGILGDKKLFTLPCVCYFPTEVPREQ